MKNSDKRHVFYFFSSLSLITLLSIVAACVSIPGTDKSAFLLFSPQEENQMGAQAYQEMLKKEHEANNPRLKNILLRVGQRISQVAESRHQVGYSWQFKLIESKEANAFCLPGGKVAFYTGIVSSLQNEAAMAIVMGHEVAHATLRHGGQRMSQTMATQLALAGAGLAAGTMVKDPKYRNMTLAALGVGATLGILLPFSRSNESEADAWGLEYAAQAGYDPREAAVFWQRFSKEGGQPEFLSTHPAGATRIENLRELEGKALELYKRSPQYGLGDLL